MSIINYFYRNNCPEFQTIKQSILHYKLPSEKQMEEWEMKHKKQLSSTILLIRHVGSKWNEEDDSNMPFPDNFYFFHFVYYDDDFAAFIRPSKHVVVDYERSWWNMSYWCEYEKTWKSDKGVIKRNYPYLL